MAAEIMASLRHQWEIEEPKPTATSAAAIQTKADTSFIHDGCYLNFPISTDF